MAQRPAHCHSIVSCTCNHLKARDFLPASISFTGRSTVEQCRLSAIEGDTCGKSRGALTDMQCELGSTRANGRFPRGIRIGTLRLPSFSPLHNDPDDKPYHSNQQYWRPVPAVSIQPLPDMLPEPPFIMPPFLRESLADSRHGQRATWQSPRQAKSSCLPPEPDIAPTGGTAADVSDLMHTPSIIVCSLNDRAWLIGLCAADTRNKHPKGPAARTPSPLDVNLCVSRRNVEVPYDAN